MNYTKTIREFCLQNKGDIFDVSYMKDTYFEMIPYKTLLKILNRLEEEGIIACVAKGVYLISEEGRDLDDAIIEHFISNARGMYGGNTMFNDLEITDHHNENVEIYTNRLNTHSKTIEEYQLTKIDIPFTPQVVSMITLLDCIEKGTSITDISVIRLNEVVGELAEEYMDAVFTIVVKAVPYHYSTIVTLKELLDRKGIQSDCIKIYERHQKLC
jgi:predicted transcriptional regulator of viral defense system